MMQQKNGPRMAVFMDVFLLLLETNSQFAPENRGRILPKKEREPKVFRGEIAVTLKLTKMSCQKEAGISLPTIHFQVRTVNNSGSG